MDADGIPYIPIDEWAALGYLQEVNRLVLHPCGLALERRSPWTEKDVEEWVEQTLKTDNASMPDRVATIWAFIQAFGMDQWTLGGVWDFRDDPEGMIYAADDIDPAKRDGVRAEMEKHREARNVMLGDDPYWQINQANRQGPDTPRYPARVQHVGEAPKN